MSVSGSVVEFAASELEVPGLESGGEGLCVEESRGSCSVIAEELDELSNFILS